MFIISLLLQSHLSQSVGHSASLPVNLRKRVQSARVTTLFSSQWVDAFQTDQEISRQSLSRSCDTAVKTSRQEVTWTWIRSEVDERDGGGGVSSFLPSFLSNGLCSALPRHGPDNRGTFFLKFLCALISLKVGSVSVGLGQLRPPGCCWLVVLLWWMSRFVWPEFHKKNWLYDISWDNVGGEQCPDWTGDIIH